MSTTRHARRLLLATTLVASGAIGAGCGDDDDIDPGVPATEGPATTTATSATTPPTSGTPDGTVEVDPQSTGDIPGDTAAGTVP